MDRDAKKPRVTMVIATRNMGKMREFKRLFSELAPAVDWVLVDGITAGLDEVKETGCTFMENARLKAVAGAQKTGGLCLGEDSGLSVDKLGGAPGVKAHRFSSTGTDEDNNKLLLELLSGVPLRERTARYTSAVCVAGPGGIVAETQGDVEGIITMSPQGTNGFGYDPLFYSNDTEDFRHCFK